MAKKLVVFYSRADENYFGGAYRYITVGNTEKLAGFIGKSAGAELFKLEQKVPYAADYQQCIAEAKADLQHRARPELVALPENFADYDEIYLGFPNYWGDMPMAVYTFIEAEDWQGKIVHPFCTHEGSGFSGIEKKLAHVCRGAKVAKGLAVRGSDVDSAAGKAAAWVK